MSLATKVFLCLILVLAVSVPLAATAQDEVGTAVEVGQHEANIWDAKVEFYRELELHQMLVAEHTASTWQAKTEFFRDLALNEHTARTWQAKAAFWQNFQLAAN